MNEKVFEETYEIDPDFHENFKEKLKVDKNKR